VTDTIEIKLGPYNQMANLFALDSTSTVDLRDLIAHGINQTMQRDGLVGSWADVYKDANDTLGVKISAPFEKVQGYAKILPAFIAAGQIGYEAYQQNLSTIRAGKLFFYLPVGLPMLTTKSVQLLHYPPYEARTYCDYLYSPTNRRWESLLGYNGYDKAGVTALERICDAVPLAGPGSDATVINEVEPAFYPYGKAMLGALLDQSGARTQPVVAYGSEAHDWLKSAFKGQIKGTPGLFSLYEIKVGTGKAVTPVLCANHPSEFLFFDEQHYDKNKKPIPKAKWAFDTMIADLIAARWQAQMAEKWDTDPFKVLAAAKKYWEAQADQVKQIVAAQEEEFGFAKASPTVRNPGPRDVVTGDNNEREVPLAQARDGRESTSDTKPVTKPASRKPSVRR
jgi:hypothetical protein